MKECLKLEKHMHMFKLIKRRQETLLEYINYYSEN